MIEANTPRNLIGGALAGMAIFAVLTVGFFAVKHRERSLLSSLGLNYDLKPPVVSDLYNPAEKFFKRGSREHRTVCLTIDDGPHPQSAGALLDILKQEHVKATFFVVGIRVAHRPDLVRRMIDEGHEVGNHTQNHYRLVILQPAQIRSQLEQCEQEIEKATGHRTTLMRPPGFRLNPEVLAVSLSMGYTVVGWNIGAKDFTLSPTIGDLSEASAQAINSTPEVIAERVEKQLKPGAIILLHDNPVTVKAMPEIIRRVRGAGYEFRTTSEFLHDLPNPIELVANPPVSPSLKQARAMGSKAPAGAAGQSL